MSLTSGAPHASLPAKEGAIGAVRPPALLAASQIHHSQATARPHWGVEMIDQADRKYRTDPTIRKPNNWR